MCDASLPSRLSSFCPRPFTFLSPGSTGSSYEKTGPESPYDLAPARRPPIGQALKLNSARVFTLLGASGGPIGRAFSPGILPDAAGPHFRIANKRDVHYKEPLPPTMPPPSASVRHIKLPTQAGGAAQKEGGLEESVRKAKCDSFPLYWENESGCWQTLGTKMVCDPMVARKHVNVVSIQRPHFDLSTDSQSLCQSAKYQLEYVTSCSGSW